MAGILVLEDDMVSRGALVSMLGKLGEEVRIDAAADLKEAEELLDSGKNYDLFLLDVNLTGKTEKTPPEFCLQKRFGQS